MKVSISVRMQFTHPEFNISCTELENRLRRASGKVLRVRVRKVGLGDWPESKEATSRVFRANVDDLLRLVPFLVGGGAIREFWARVDSFVYFFKVHHDARAIRSL